MPTLHPAVELHLRLRVLPGKRDAFLAFLREATPYYESGGRTRVRLLQDRADPDRFVEIMEYDTEDDYLAGEQSVASDPVIQSYLKRWRALLDGPPVVEVFYNRTTECGV